MPPILPVFNEHDLFLQERKAKHLKVTHFSKINKMRYDTSQIKCLHLPVPLARYLFYCTSYSRNDTYSVSKRLNLVNNT